MDPVLRVPPRQPGRRRARRGFKAGFRSVGQWAFRNPRDAQRWAEQHVFCNGLFDVY